MARLMYPANACQAYHTPPYLQERLKTTPYNKHLCFVHKNVSFYCLLSEYVNIRADGSFIHPYTLDYVARSLKTSLLQISWPERLDRNFLEREISNMFMGIDSTFLVSLQDSSASFQEEHSLSSCSVALMLCQGGFLWGAQLGKNRLGLCCVNDVGRAQCISPCDEHSYENEKEQTRLLMLGLNQYDLSEFFQYQQRFMPTRCIGNAKLKERYDNSILRKASSPPIISDPDIWGPVNIEHNQVTHAFIINDDLYKVFERHCMFKIYCPVMEKVGELIIKDHRENDNSKQSLFNDCSRRVIETVLKAVGTSQLNDLYSSYNIIDMGIIICDFDKRYYCSDTFGDTPIVDEEPRSNPSGPQGKVVDYSSNFNNTPPPVHSLHESFPIPPPSLDNKTLLPEVIDKPVTPDLPSIPNPTVPAYLRFEPSNQIWNIKSMDELMNS